MQRAHAARLRDNDGIIGEKTEALEDEEDEEVREQDRT